MLKDVDLNLKLSKDDHKTREDRLDLRLAVQQRELRAAGISTVIVVEGWDASGKGYAIGRLLRPLDPRGFKVYAMGPHTGDERNRPPLWRFWTLLPARGAIAVFERSWYRRVLEEQFDENLAPNEVKRAYNQINTFERQLHDDGVQLIKLFLHISKEEQAARFKQILKKPSYAWKVGKLQLRQNKRYSDYFKLVNETLRETSAPHAPWTVTAATDRRHADVENARTVSEAFQRALDHHARSEKKLALASRGVGKKLASTDKLKSVALDKSLSRGRYKSLLPELQARLRDLQHQCYAVKTPIVIVYEGWDAAGKGGNIRRLTAELDPRGFEVVPVAAPQGDEIKHHYLWRFWRNLPPAGHMTIFDRSWYGRVLVERVEGFATQSEWKRAFQEINEFEEQIVQAGAVLVKFWMHISKEEQLRRFEDRRRNPEKEWKITSEDWRNRERWSEYWTAASDMLALTSTKSAPWTIVEGNDKNYARIKTLKTLVNDLTRAVARSKRKTRGKS